MGGWLFGLLGELLADEAEVEGRFVFCKDARLLRIESRVCFDLLFVDRDI